jgi:putative ABC transport system permease protein
VAATIIMISVSAGARMSIEDHVAAEGTNIIYLYPKARFLQGVRGLDRVVTRLTIGDATEFQSSIPAIREVCWLRRDPSQIVRGHRNLATGVYGVSPGCLLVKNWVVREGDALTVEHDRSGALAALLGQTVVDQLFDPGEDPVGSRIRINRVEFMVLGVLAPKGHAAGGYDQDDLILIPFSAAQRRVYGAKIFEQAESIAVSTYEKSDLPEAAKHMRAVLRFRHRLSEDQPDDFVLRTQLEIEQFYEGTGQILGELLFWLACGSLVAGLIGVVNVLLVSVVQRTREIGVRMAVGGTQRQILLEFLCEAVILGILGAVIGLVTGSFLSTVIGYYAGWPMYTPVSETINIILGVVMLSTVCGFYPAWKASSVSPITALRHE